jgi:hypothetical protein
MTRRRLKVLLFALFGFDALLLYRAFGLFPPHWPKEMLREGAALRVAPVPWTTQDSAALAILIVVHLLVLFSIRQLRPRRDSPQHNP